MLRRQLLKGFLSIAMMGPLSVRTMNLAEAIRPTSLTEIIPKLLAKGLLSLRVKPIMPELILKSEELGTIGLGFIIPENLQKHFDHLPSYYEKDLNKMNTPDPEEYR
jgi:hypothetical protein